MKQNHSNDMTKGTEWKSILFFSLPLMASTLLQTLYTFVDSVIIGNFVGPTAFGAIGLLSSLIMLLTFCTTSLGNGTSIVTAQFFGARRSDDVKSTGSSGLILAGLTGIGLTLLCFILSQWIVVDFLNTPESMEAYSITYLRVYSCGLLFQFLYNASYGILRAHGDSKGAMIFLLIASCLNVGLDLVFVVGLSWGVAGAALATTISQAGSALACMIYLLKHYPEFSFRLAENRKLCGDKVRLILKIALPILCQTSILSIGFMGLQRLVNSFGDPSIEGYAAMQRVESFIHIIPNTLNTAISSFTGQNMGAGRPDRIRRGYRATVIMGVGASAVIAVILTTFSQPLLGLFKISPEAMVRATEHLNLLVIFMLAYSVNTITSGLLQGSGDVKITAVASFANLFIRVSVAYIMAGTFINFRCVYYSLPPAWVTCTLINVLRYKSGIWEKKGITS